MSSSASGRIGAYCHAKPESHKCVRSLILDGCKLPVGVDGVVAVIDGLTDAVAETYLKLEVAFENRRAKLTSLDTEQPRVEDLLRSAQSGRASLALALWAGATVVIGCVGGSGARVFHVDRPMGESDERAEPSFDGSGRVSRFSLSAEDVIILIDSSVATHVEEAEIRLAGRGGFSDFFTEENAAAWLGTLALRSGETAGVAVVRFAQSEAGISALTRVLHPSLPSFSGTGTRGPAVFSRRGIMGSRPLKLTAVAFLGIAFAIFGTALLAHSFAATGASSPASKHEVVVHPLAGSSITRLIPANHRRTSRTTPSQPTVTQGVSQFSQSWRFPPLPNAPHGRVVLTLYNSWKTTVVRRVRIVGSSGVKTWTETVPGGKTVGIALAPGEVRDIPGRVTALYVQSSKPIVPLRVVVGS